MTKIDETTGLAALPEDMFWRIEESVLHTGTHERSVGAVRMVLMEKTVHQYDGVTKFRDEPNSFWRRLFTGERYKSVAYETDSATRTTERVLRRVDFLITEDEVPEGGTGWEPYTLYDSWEGEHTTRYFKVVPPTAELLTKNSLSAWQDYLNAEHEMALEEDARVDLEKILGDYPPKSVHALVNA